MTAMGEANEGQVLAYSVEKLVFIFSNSRRGNFI